PTFRTVEVDGEETVVFDGWEYTNNYRTFSLAELLDNQPANCDPIEPEEVEACSMVIVHHGGHVSVSLCVDGCDGVALLDDNGDRIENSGDYLIDGQIRPVVVSGCGVT